jgi:hypothetical protein
MCDASDDENFESGEKICLSRNATMYLVPGSVASGFEIALLAKLESFEAARMR